MTKWWQTLITALEVPPIWAFALFVVFVLIFALLCFAMKHGQRVSLGGAKGFVFEALPPTSSPGKGQK